MSLPDRGENDGADHKRNPHAVQDNVLWAVIGTGWVLFTVGMAMRHSAGVSRSDASETFWMAVIIVAAIAIPLCFGPAVPQYRRLSTLRLRFPQALVLSMFRADGTKPNLRFLGNDVSGLGHYFVLVVHDGAIEFWTGFSHLRKVASVPVAEIDRVDLGPGVVGLRVTKVICLALTVASAERASDTSIEELETDPNSEPFTGWLQVLPTMGGVMVSAVQTKAAKIDEVAQRLSDRIGVESGREMPPVVWREKP